MKKINWLANIGAVCAFNTLGLIMLHFDERVSKCDGALILGSASIFIMLYAIADDLSRDEV